jgi:Fis family transcriptional regulator
MQIDESVRNSLKSYLRDLGASEPDGMYNMVVNVVEKPLLEIVMQHADNNQSKAAQWLGLNRNTLRKKLLEHKLIT